MNLRRIWRWNELMFEGDLGLLLMYCWGDFYFVGRVVGILLFVVEFDFSCCFWGVDGLLLLLENVDMVCVVIDGIVKLSEEGIRGFLRERGLVGYGKEEYKRRELLGK